MVDLSSPALGPIFDRILGFLGRLWNDRRRSAILLVLALVLFTFSFSAIYSVLSLVPFLDNPLSGGARPAVSANDWMRLARVGRNLDRNLAIAGGEILKRQTESQSWTIADIVVALRRDEVGKLWPEDDPMNYFEAEMSEQGCWERSASSNCHLGATAWVFLAYAELEKPAPNSAWQFILDSQTVPAGYWRLYSEAVDEEKNASTYATAIALLALQEHYSQRLVPSDLMREAKYRMELATTWLSSVTGQGDCPWLDYPGRLKAAKCISSLEGLAIYALAKMDVSYIREIDISRLSARPAPVQEADVSRVELEMKSGATAIDHVGHLSLTWVGFALLKAFPDAGWLDRARIRRFFQKSFFGETKTPEALLDQPWKQAEIYMLISEIASFSNVGLSDAS